MLIFLFLNLDVFFQVLDSFLIAIGTLSMQTSVMPLKPDLLPPLFIFLLNFLLHIFLHLSYFMFKDHLLIFHLQNALLLKSLNKFEVTHFYLVHFRIRWCYLFLLKLDNF